MPAWYALAVIVLSTLTMALLAIGIAQHTARESERKWCSIVVTLDDAYRQTPPSSTVGRQLAADMAQLRRDLGC